MGLLGPRPSRRRLLPPLDGTIGSLQEHVTAPHHGPMIRNAVLHLNNEQPVVVDLFDLPQSVDLGVRCTNMRTLDGKRPVFIDDIKAVFFFPYEHVRFVEIPPRSLIGTELEVARRAARRGRGVAHAHRIARRRQPRDRRGLPPAHPRGLAPRPSGVTGRTSPANGRGKGPCRTRCYTPGRVKEPRHRRIARQGAHHRAVSGPGLSGPRLVRARPRPAREPGQGQVRRGRRPRLRARIRHQRRPAQAGQRHREGGEGLGPRLPRDGPRPRGRGDRVARRGGSARARPPRPAA